MASDATIAGLGEMIGKSITAGVEGYRTADQERRANARQNLQDAITFLSPEMAGAAYDEMVRPDPVSMWTGLAKPVDTSKQRAAITNYITMKKREQEAALAKAEMVPDGLLATLPPSVVTPAAPMVPPLIAETTPAPIVPASAPMPEQMDAPVIPPGTPTEFGTMTPGGPSLGDVMGGLAALPKPPADTVLGPPVPGSTAPIPPAPNEAGDVSQNYILPGWTPGNPMGMVKPGNVDLTTRPVIKNPDGSISTVKSFSIEIDGKEVLLPMAINGKVLSEAEAVKHYYQTGENLGTFATPEAADAYGKALHEQQATLYGQPQARAPDRSVASLPADLALNVAAPAEPAPAAPEPPKIVVPGPEGVKFPGYSRPVPGVTELQALAFQTMLRQKGVPENRIPYDFRGWTPQYMAKQMTGWNMMDSAKAGKEVEHQGWVTRQDGTKVWSILKPGQVSEPESKESRQGWVVQKDGSKVWAVLKPGQVSAADSGDAHYGWVSKGDGTKVWSILKPGQVSKEEPDADSYGWVNEKDKTGKLRKVWRKRAPGTVSEDDESPADRALREMRIIQTIDGILKQEFPIAVPGTTSWEARTKRESELLRKAGLPDTTGVAGESALDKLMKMK